MSVARLCALLGVTRAGYYAWRQRPASPRLEQDRKLLAIMESIFERSGGTYGSPRLHRALAVQGHRISRRRVERLMRAGGLKARVMRVYRRKAGTHRWFGQHPNRVKRTLATRPDQIWVGDVTYLPVGGRWWFLATILDQYSRRVLSWRLGSIRDARLTRAAIDAAFRRRRPEKGLIFHSDRGSEFLGSAFTHHLEKFGVCQSTTRGGSPDENAHIESFFHSLKADLIHGERFGDIRELRRHLQRYVRYYNYRRMHSALQYHAPVDYERGAA
jgi:transposase InsO family protein